MEQYVISDYAKVPEQVKEITEGKMADVVLNSLGVRTWDNSFACIGMNGRWVTCDDEPYLSILVNLFTIIANKR
jgi:NADPH:quinone reductase-like Zn-dependent oxidoreductase